jgi:hypothetical protein
MEQRNHAISDAADTLLVMEAPGGEIESFDILCLQGKTSEEVDKLLSRSLNRFCTVADSGNEVPDNRLKVYDCGADAHLENLFWRFATDPEAIGNYIDARNLMPYMDVPLRTAHYVYLGNHGIRNLEALEISPDTALPEMGISLGEHLESGRTIDRHGPGVHLVTGIETDRGKLYFSDDGIGTACLHNYLQDIADRYFDTSNRGLSDLRHSHTQANLTTLEFTQQTKGMFCLHNHAPIARRIVYQDPRADEYMQGLRLSLPMGANAQDFLRFTETFSLTVSEKNRTICALLNIHDKGVDNQAEVPTAHRRDCRGLLDRMKSICGDAEQADALRISLRQESAALAGRLLREKYGIAVHHPDHPQLNRRVDPTGIKPKNSHKIHL